MISKQIDEEQRLWAYNVRKRLKNRRDGINNKRFGERDKKFDCRRKNVRKIHWRKAKSI